MKLKTYTVSEVNRYINRSLEGDPILSALTVQGELSNYKLYPSGHAYFTIKDDNAKLSCVMFKNNTKCISEDFKEGTNVKVAGYISVYEREGRYQLICHTIEHLGVGKLYEKYLQLLKKIESKGYFDISCKKTLPTVWKIGVITSSKGAAIKDFTSILKRRNPLIEIHIYPTVVQGDQAANQIIKGIDYFNSNATVDIIVITRGGGAIEDLWAFNDEYLAEAIYHSVLPIISAIGHETDFTIADFVADLRAPTPSAAAEIVSTTHLELKNTIKQITLQMALTLQGKIDLAKEKLHANHPKTLTCALSYYLKQSREVCCFTMQKLANDTNLKLDNARIRSDAAYSIIKYQNPALLLKKGYTFIKDKEGCVVMRKVDLKTSDYLQIVFSDGTVAAKVLEVENEEKNNF